MSSNVNNNVNNISVNLSGYGDRQQVAWILRALYFLVIGFWFAGIWIAVAYLVALTIIGLPLANSMFNKTAAVMTLQR